VIETGLHGKVAVITGGGSGIGLATVRRFAAEGAHVAVWDIQHPSTPLTPAEDGPGDVVPVLVDVRDASAVAAATHDVVRRWGRLDVLVNNAGITRDARLVKWSDGAPLATMSDGAFDEVMDVNARGVFVCTRAVAPVMMAARQGVILNAASIVGLYGNIGQTNYAGAKAAVIGMTRTWARELGPHGIRVNAVAPGMVATPMVAGMPEKIRSQLVARTPLGRLGSPSEIADTYVWLASDAATFVHGAVISVDGGLVVGT
jgi:3-oxoacyl-[acyl-carrier protein] reductase